MLSKFKKPEEDKDKEQTARRSSRGVQSKQKFVEEVYEKVAPLLANLQRPKYPALEEGAVGGAESEGEGDKAKGNRRPLPPDVAAKMKVQAERFKKMADLLRTAQATGNLDFLSRRMGDLLPIFPSNSSDKIAYKLIQRAKQMVWDRMSADLLSKDDLLHFYGVLEKWSNISPFPISARAWTELQRRMVASGAWSFDKYITHDHYFKAKAELDSRFDKILTGLLFLSLLGASDDQSLFRVPIIVIFNYVMKRTWLQETRLSLMNYDDFNTGFLTEDALESYIRDHIPTLYQLADLEPTLEPFYLCAVTRRFFFFLDPNHTGRIKILDALCSMLIDDILDLREPEVNENNWFSKESTMRVYQHYLRLDTDQNGMLSQSEFLGYCYSSTGVANCRLTATFVKKLFEEKMTYNGEMDFRSYVDFVLAMENPKEKQSIQYFMSVLDIGKKGFLNTFDLHYFYKDILKTLPPNNPETPKFDDVRDEIFDLVKPKKPERITKEDLMNCGKQDVVISMLIDAKSFDDYENRDFVIPQSPALPENREMLLPQSSTLPDLPQSPPSPETRDILVAQSINLPQSPPSPETRDILVAQSIDLPQSPPSPETRDILVAQSINLPQSPPSPETRDILVAQSINLPQSPTSPENQDILMPQSSTLPDLPQSPPSPETRDILVAQSINLPQSPPSPETRNILLAQSINLPQSPPSPENQDILMPQSRTLPVLPPRAPVRKLAHGDKPLTSEDMLEELEVCMMALRVRADEDSPPKPKPLGPSFAMNK